MSASHDRLKDAVITVNSVEIGNRSNNVSVNRSKALIEVTGFTDAGAVHITGDSDDSFDVDFYMGYGAGSIEATLWPLHDNDTEFTVTVQPYVGSPSVDNPLYSAACILPDVPLVKGKRGDVHVISCTFKVNGKISRDIGS